MRTATALLIFCCISSVAFAGAAAPMPATTDLANGYGVIAAELLAATPVLRSGGEYDFRFRVHSVLARPVDGAFFPAKAGEIVRLKLSCSIYGELRLSASHNSLAPGAKYILTIKHVAGNGYIHASGVEAATEVPNFTDAQAVEYARLEQIAKLPYAEQSDQLVLVVGDASASEPLRFQALSSLDLWDLNDPS